MEDIGTKVENGGISAAGRYAASEFNGNQTERETAVTSAGQSLAIGTTDQLSKSLFINGISASTMTAGGTANAITLVPPTGSTGLRVFESYSHAEGARVIFVVNITNTGTVTIQIGQTVGTLLAARGVKQPDGVTVLSGGELVAGEWAEVIYDVSSGSWVLLPWTRVSYTNVIIFTSGGTYNKPNGLKKAISEVQAGGGGAGGCFDQGGNTWAATQGGGGGGYSRKEIAASAIGSTETVTVGTGGAGGALGANDGTDGGTSSFGSHHQATGGALSTGYTGAQDNIINADSGIGGVGSGGDINVQGGTGGRGIGVGPDNSPNEASGGHGGSSFFGAGAPCVPLYDNGVDAVTPGSGGSGSATANGSGGTRSGGDGADGLVIVTEYF